jgi:ATP-dependent RNA helicase DeaD
MKYFSEFSLPHSLEKSLESLGMKQATEVQTKAIPAALKGKDLIVSAPTGTGKTLAFCIPIIAELISDKNKAAIVVAPTRELAAQVMEVFQSLLKFEHSVKSVLLIGGMPMGKQLAKLKAFPQIIVGTPGRMNDHLQRRTLRLANISHVVLDEMDRMLDMGFSIQIDEIYKSLPKQKQVMMFSATIPPAIEKSTGKYLQDPVKIAIAAGQIVNANISEEFLHTTKEKKYDGLLEQMSKRQGSMLIFVKTKRDTESLAKRLSQDDYRAKAIHGDLRQHQRDRVIKLLREEVYDIVVATDVASRGIDVPHIRHVINYNLPTNPEDYVHRVGRTGRAGKDGAALSFVSADERKEWRALEGFLYPDRVQEKVKSSSGKGKRKYGNSNGPRQESRSAKFSSSKYAGKSSEKKKFKFKGSEDRNLNSDSIGNSSGHPLEKKRFASKGRPRTENYNSASVGQDSGNAKGKSKFQSRDSEGRNYNSASVGHGSDNAKGKRKFQSKGSSAESSNYNSSSVGHGSDQVPKKKKFKPKHLEHPNGNNTHGGRKSGAFQSKRNMDNKGSTSAKKIVHASSGGGFSGDQKSSLAKDYSDVRVTVR